MKPCRTLVAFGLLALCCLCAFAEPVQPSDSKLTPPAGSPSRRAILEALRQEVGRMHGLDVVFVVAHLKVKDGWAWVHTRPRSPDARNRYEDLSALLRFQDGVWSVVEIPCTEADNPECIDGPDSVERLRRRFPEVPGDIFSGWPPGVGD